MVSSPHYDVDVRDVRCSFLKICPCDADSFKSRLWLTKSRFKASITIHHNDQPTRTVCQPRQNWGEADRSSQQIFATSKTYILTSRSLQLVCKYDMAAKVSGKFIKSEDPNLYRQKMEWMDSYDRHDRHGKHYARG